MMNGCGKYDWNKIQPTVEKCDSPALKAELQFAPCSFLCSSRWRLSFQLRRQKEKKTPAVPMQCSNDLLQEFKSLEYCFSIRK